MAPNKARAAARAPPRTSIEEFQTLLERTAQGTGRVLALCGAGLSASSGLPTFRDKGGLWRRHRATDLATPEAFDENPGLVWLFYAWRRHKALVAEPNAAHFALARLADRLTLPVAAADPSASASAAAAATEATRFLCLTQNVDNLSQRAGHPATSLRPMHGRLFDLRCSSEDGCDYVERDNLSDPLCPALAPSSEDDPAWLADPDLPAPEVAVSDLPICPACKRAPLRPGVVWFGEPLPDGLLDEADDYVEGPPAVEVMLVVGTAAAVHPAAGYIAKAKRRGAVVAVVNPDPDSGRGLGPEDYFFEGDAAEIVPRLVEKAVGTRRG